jgi:hypothetical protein
METLNLLILCLLFYMVKSLGSQMQSLDTRMQGVETITSKSLYMHNQSHHFVKDRVKILSSVTLPHSLPPSHEGNTTSVALYHKGYVAEVTVAHRSVVPREIDTMLSACLNIDIAFSRPAYAGCPPHSAALNTSLLSSLEEGDQVVSYGFGQYLTSWTGFITGGFFDDPKERTHLPFTPSAKIHVNEFFVTGNQSGGASGAVLLNSYGIVGIAHAVNKNHTRVVFVIPMSLVLQCFDEKIQQKMVTSNKKCKMKVVNPPIFGV